MATKSAPLRRVQVRCFMPLWSRFIIVKRDNLTGEVLMIEVIWASRSRWRRWCEHHDTSALEARNVGPFILAVGLS